MNQHIAVKPDVTQDFDAMILKAREERLAEEAMDSAAQEIASNVVNLEPETELERHIRIHRGIVEQQERKAVAAREQGKIDAADIKRRRQELADEEANNKAATRLAINTANRIAKASRAALDSLIASEA